MGWGPEGKGVQGGGESGEELVEHVRSGKREKDGRSIGDLPYILEDGFLRVLSNAVGRLV